MGSITKKFRTITRTGFEPIIQGRRNYNRNIPSVEEKAKQRAQTCGECESNVEEPVKSLQISDARIAELSNRMCDMCGCPLTYLLRQDKKVCTLWK